MVTIYIVIDSHCRCPVNGHCWSLSVPSQWSLLVTVSSQSMATVSHCQCSVNGHSLCIVIVSHCQCPVNGNASHLSVLSVNGHCQSLTEPSQCRLLVTVSYLSMVTVRQRQWPNKWSKALDVFKRKSGCCTYRKVLLAKSWSVVRGWAVRIRESHTVERDCNTLAAWTGRYVLAAVSAAGCSERTSCDVTLFQYDGRLFHVQMYGGRAESEDTINTINNVYLLTE